MVNIIANTIVVYKVVEREGKVLHSVHAAGKYQTKYPAGRYVNRENLFVFLKLKDAKKFRGAIQRLEIWECETTSDPRPAPLWVPDYEYTEHYYKGVSLEEADKLIQAFWEHPYGYYQGPLEVLGMTEGSYLVDNIKLIRQVG